MASEVLTFGTRLHSDRCGLVPFSGRACGEWHVAGRQTAV